MDNPRIIYTTGDDLFVVPTESSALIDGVLWDGDVCMMLGSEKAGKSLLAMQMAFSLTSQDPFLDKYTVPAKVPIAYVQTEGKRDDFARRMACMRNAVDVDPALFHHFYRKFFPLDDPENIKVFEGMLATLSPMPKVLFLDSLYTSMSGDLIDNQDVRQLIATLSPFLDAHKMTLVVIHHETKKEWDNDAKRWIEKGDRSSYGSVFLRAWVEHILYLNKLRDKTRTFSCETQRSGKVMEKEELILVEPDPLAFQIKEDATPSMALIRAHLCKTPGISREEIAKFTLLSTSAITKTLRVMLKEKIVCKSNGRPVLYAPYGHTFQT